MGYVLFEQSGTFKPSDYGLVTGDPIQVVVVGGGGGGNVHLANGAGTSGTASSFGSYFSAAGGNCAAADFPANTIPFMTRNIIKQTSASAVKSYYVRIFISSFGDDGWLPTGVPPLDLSGLAATLISGEGPVITPVAMFSAGRTIYVSTIGNAMGVKEQSARTDKRGGNAYIQYPEALSVSETTLYVCACGGLGYGAGGAGMSIARVADSSGSITLPKAYKGGSAGHVVTGSMLLPSTANITVTIGNGGVGAYNTNSSGYYAFAGGGARGCVAVFW